MNWIYLAIVAGVISLGVALYIYFWVIKQDAGTERAKEVASWIKEGARAYLVKLYRALGILAVLIGVIIAVVFSIQPETAGGGAVTMHFKEGLVMSVAFIAGAISSAVSGYLGMRVAVEANVRTATAANFSLSRAFKLSFNAGAVLGLAMVGMAVIGMSLILLWTGTAEAVLGFSFGAST